jgi:hypothetical protein
MGRWLMSPGEAHIHLLTQIKRKRSALRETRFVKAYGFKNPEGRTRGSAPTLPEYGAGFIITKPLCACRRGW